MNIFLWLAYALCFMCMAVCGVGAACLPRAERAKDEPEVASEHKEENKLLVPTPIVVANAEQKLVHDKANEALEKVVDAPETAIVHASDSGTASTDEVYTAFPKLYPIADQRFNQNARFRVRFE
jgi:hypothetical protein